MSNGRAAPAPIPAPAPARARARAREIAIYSSGGTTSRRRSQRGSGFSTPLTGVNTVARLAIQDSAVPLDRASTQPHLGPPSLRHPLAVPTRRSAVPCGFEVGPRCARTCMLASGGASFV